MSEDQIAALEQEWKNQLPEWAIGRTEGELVLGAQLPTRDGRRMGNAHIIEITPPMTPHFQTAYTILTDAGNRVVMTDDEITKCFWPPQWVADVDEVIKKFDRS